MGQRDLGRRPRKPAEPGIIVDTESENKPKIDRFLPLKHVAYCWSQGALGDTSLRDYVKYCKFQLCVLNHRLMKDPVWDEYSEEEIIAEYLAHAFQKDPLFVKEFEIGLAKGEVLDFNEWADLQMKRDKESEEQKIQDQEDRVSFQPDDVMGEN
jgi:hypothetical protein